MTRENEQVWTQGLIAGVIGYATVAVLCAIEDALTGRSPFYTAAALGATVFYGIDDPARVVVSAPYVLAFNGAHLVAFLVFGLVASWLAKLADQGHQFWFIAGTLFVVIGFHLVAAAALLARNVESALPWQQMWTSGLAGSALIAAYLLWAHPRLRASQRWDDDD